MKKLLYLLCLVMCFSQVQAQVNIVNPGNVVPALQVGYPSLQSAITALNATTNINGPVTIELLSDETAPSGGFVINIQATNAGNHLIILEGNNHVVQAFSPQTAGSKNDAIIKLIGADRIVIQGFDLQENIGNIQFDAATNTMTEWGIALLVRSSNDGAQFNVIAQNSISLNRDYPNSFGIYSNTNHSATDVETSININNATDAPNQGNVIQSNTIQNVNYGISITGSIIDAYMDVNNRVGGNVISEGNEITNWGSLPHTISFAAHQPQMLYGILMNHQKNDEIAFNTVSTNFTQGTNLNSSGIDVTFTGDAPTGSFVKSIKHNIISLQSIIAGNYSIYGIRCGAISAANSLVTIHIDSNDISGNQINHATATARFTGIMNEADCGKLIIKGNSFYNNSYTGGQQSFSGILNAGVVTDSIFINNNILGDNNAPCLTMPGTATQMIYGIHCSTAGTSASMMISGNNFQGFNYLSPAQNPIHFIEYNHNQITASTDEISNNTFTNLNLQTYELVMLISGNGGLMSTNAGAKKLIINNSIVGGLQKYHYSSYATPLICIYDAGSSRSGNIKRIANNNFSDITFTGSSGSINGIFNVDGSANFGGAHTTIENNQFHNWNCNTQSITVIRSSNACDSTFIINNSIQQMQAASSITAIELHGGVVSPVTPIYKECSNNTISGLVSTGTGGGDMVGISTNGANQLVRVYNNTVLDFSSSKGSPLSGIRLMNGAASEAMVFKNKIANFTGNHPSASGVVSGIEVLAGEQGVNRIHNNYIGHLQSLTINSANAIRGINIASVQPQSAFDVFYNTIYLNAPASSGTNFGTSGIYAVADADALNGMLNLRNNIIVNVSAVAGGGITAAIRRSASTLGNFATTSGNNLFYCGTPSSTHVILRYSTTSDQTLAAYQTRVFPREQMSVTELPPFKSYTVSNPDYLHIDELTPTKVESGALAIPTYTFDYDDDIRQGNPGYVGTGTAPDIGADEFEGLKLVPVNFTSISAILQSDKSVRIQWTVEQEINMEMYVLEKSHDGLNFYDITTQTPMYNNSQGTYVHNDYTMHGSFAFYKVRAISSNGRVQYSAVVSVSTGNNAPSISVFPNPISGTKISLLFNNHSTGPFQWRIFSMNSALVQQGSNVLMQEHEMRNITLPRALPPGIYSIQLHFTNGKRWNSKICVVN